LNKNLKIASHLHSPAQIIKAIKLNIPCILLIRHPIDAVASLLLMNGNLTSKAALNDYIRFYNILKNTKCTILIVKFDDIIQNPNKVIGEFNSLYEYNFACDLSSSELEIIRNQLKEEDRKLFGESHTSHHIPSVKVNPSFRIKKQTL